MDIILQLDPEAADQNVVLHGLRTYNSQAVGRPSGYLPMAVLLKHPESGETMGGLTGNLLWDWLFIELLHIPEALRGQGFGTALMARAEDFARQRGLVGIWLDTFEFQARPFYEKLGYEVFGQIDDFPRGSTRYFLRKYL